MMNDIFRAAMRDALRQTRSMDLRAATRSIQAALRGDPGPDTHRGGASAERRPLAPAHTGPTLDLTPKAAPTPGFAEADGAVDELRPDRATIDSADEIGADSVAADQATTNFRVQPDQPEADTAAIPAAAGPAPYGKVRTDRSTVRAKPIPLGIAVQMLRHGRSALVSGAMDGLARVRPTAAPDVPPGARYEARSFAAAAGQRDYKLFVPATADGQFSGLVLMLHGCKQNPDDFAIGTGMNALAQRHGLVVAYPHQPQAANAAGCWNWFDPSSQKRAAGEPAILAGIAEVLAAEFDIDRGKIFAAGLSAGGAMAAVLGETHPDVFSAIGVHSGLPYGAARDVVTAFAAMRGDPPDASPTTATWGNPPRTSRPATAGGNPPKFSDPSTAGRIVRTIVFHGTADRTVHPVNGDRVAARAGGGDRVGTRESGTAGGRDFERRLVLDASLTPIVEHWTIAGAGHAWSGGHPDGSYTDPDGPDATAEMIRFFIDVG